MDPEHQIVAPLPHEGSYALHFSLGTRREKGTLALRHGVLAGDLDGFRLNGRIRRGETMLAASVDVLSIDRRAPEPSLVAAFRVQMTGLLESDGFTLIGAGPLGIIVEIDCSATTDR